MKMKKFRTEFEIDGEKVVIEMTVCPTDEIPTLNNKIANEASKNNDRLMK